MKKMQILDTTLREGEQTPGVAFSVKQKLAVARMLDAAAVDMIELGHPAVSAETADFVTVVAREGLRAELVAHSRACDSDIEIALSTGVGRVAVFLGASRSHLAKLGVRANRDLAEMAYRSVKKVTAAGAKARFTAEDATRADLDDVLEICRAAVEAGADRISLPDTVGIGVPDGVRALFRRVKKELGRVGLDAHCHNDLGLALANSLAAYEGGADCIHVTVNGLGERAGITSLCNLAVALKVLYGVESVELARLGELSHLVEELSGVPIPVNSPVVGRNAFSHKAGVHSSGVLKDPSTYEPYSPSLVQRERMIVVDKYTGRDAVRERLRRLGVDLPEQEISSVVEMIKRCSRSAAYSDEDLRRLAAELPTKRRQE